jgi:ComF family protein
LKTGTLDRETRAILFHAPANAGNAFWPRVRRGVDAALDLVFPPHCASCGTPLLAADNKALCLACAEQMRWIGGDRCKLCGDAVGQGSGVVAQCGSCRSFPPRFIETISSAVVYGEGPSRNVVLALKFGRKLHVARLMGNVVARRIELTGQAVRGMVVVPAPLTRRGLRERGFNLAEEIARVVARRLSLRLETNLLEKIRATPPQATLGREKRHENLSGAFGCNARLAKRYSGATLLLIDDVITTGSTVSECARTLDAAGLKSVRAASFARG